MKTELSNEDAFLIRVISRFIGEDTKRENLEELSALNWEHIIWQATLHKIIPILYQDLQTLNIVGIIPNTLYRLMRAYSGYMFYVNSLLLRHAIDTLKGILEETECAILKGPVLAAYLYPTKMRCFSDIDLLISKESLPIVKEYLVSQGYVQGKLDRNKDIIRLASRKDILFKEMFSHETVEFHKIVPDIYKTDVVIDLNYSFSWKAKDASFRIDDLRDSTYAYPTEEGVLVGLKPELLFIHTCMHLYSESVYFCEQYSWNKNYGDLELSKYIDIALLIKKNIDYGKVDEYIKDFGCEEAIAFVLSHTQKLFSNLVFPAELKKYTRDIGEVSYYYTLFGTKTKWTTPFERRMFDQQLRYHDVLARANIEDFKFLRNKGNANGR